MLHKHEKIFDNVNVDKIVLMSIQKSEKLKIFYKTTVLTLINVPLVTTVVCFSRLLNV